MLEQKLMDDMKDAMRAGAQARLSTIRMLRAELLKLKKDGSGRTEISDEEVLKVLASYAKRVKESVEQFRAGGSEDLAVQAEAELVIVESYLPQQLSDAELEALVKESVSAAGATSAKDLGKVMKEAQARAAGRADGKRLSEMVRKALGG